MAVLGLIGLAAILCIPILAFWNAGRRPKNDADYEGGAEDHVGAWDGRDDGGAGDA